MNKAEITNHILSMGPATLKNRQRVAALFLSNHEFIETLLQLLFESKKDLSIRAAYTLELVCLERLDLVLPYIEYYTLNIRNVSQGSAIRSLSKICSLLAIAYTKNYPYIVRESLNSEHIERMVEAGFDWLISEHKVAVKVHSMELLYRFGTGTDWIHDELKLIIEKNMGYESCGYQARGKRILDLLNKQVI